VESARRFQALQAHHLTVQPDMSAAQAAGSVWALASMRALPQATATAVAKVWAAEFLGSDALLDHAQVLWALAEANFVPRVRTSWGPSPA
jgi:hypothetical protein